jgi:hypothetical protein
MLCCIVSLIGLVLKQQVLVRCYPSHSTPAAPARCTPLTLPSANPPPLPSLQHDAPSQLQQQQRYRHSRRSRAAFQPAAVSLPAPLADAAKAAASLAGAAKSVVQGGASSSPGLSIPSHWQDMLAKVPVGKQRMLTR